MLQSGDSATLSGSLTITTCSSLTTDGTGVISFKPGDYRDHTGSGVNIQAGNAAKGAFDGGSVVITLDTRTKSVSGNVELLTSSVVVETGDIILQTGTSSASGSSGSITIDIGELSGPIFRDVEAGTVFCLGGTGGAVEINAGYGSNTDIITNGGSGGDINLTGGSALCQSTSNLGGDINLIGGLAAVGQGGSFSLLSGASPPTFSGNINIKSSNAGTVGTSGCVDINSGIIHTGRSGSISAATGQSHEAKAGDISISNGEGDTGDGAMVTITVGRTTDISIKDGGNIVLTLSSDGDIQLLTGTSGSGGVVSIVGGAAVAVPGGGDVKLQSGVSTDRSSGKITLITSNAGISGVSGDVLLQTGLSNASASGYITLQTGVTTNANVAGGDVSLLVGTFDTGDGFIIILSAGITTAHASADGGVVEITGGTGASTHSVDASTVGMTNAANGAGIGTRLGDNGAGDYAVAGVVLTAASSVVSGFVTGMTNAANGAGGFVGDNGAGDQAAAGVVLTAASSVVSGFVTGITNAANGAGNGTHVGDAAAGSIAASNIILTIAGSAVSGFVTGMTNAANGAGNGTHLGDNGAGDQAAAVVILNAANYVVTQFVTIINSTANGNGYLGDNSLGDSAVTELILQVANSSAVNGMINTINGSANAAGDGTGHLGDGFVGDYLAASIMRPISMRKTALERLRFMSLFPTLMMKGLLAMKNHHTNIILPIANSVVSGFVDGITTAANAGGHNLGDNGLGDHAAAVVILNTANYVVTQFVTIINSTANGNGYFTGFVGAGNTGDGGHYIIMTAGDINSYLNTHFADGMYGGDFVDDLLIELLKYFIKFLSYFIACLIEVAKNMGTCVENLKLIYYHHLAAGAKQLVLLFLLYHLVNIIIFPMKFDTLALLMICLIISLIIIVGRILLYMSPFLNFVYRKLKFVALMMIYLIIDMPFESIYYMSHFPLFVYGKCQFFASLVPILWKHFFFVTRREKYVKLNSKRRRNQVLLRKDECNPANWSKNTRYRRKTESKVKTMERFSNLSSRYLFFEETTVYVMWTIFSNLVIVLMSLSGYNFDLLSIVQLFVMWFIFANFELVFLNISGYNFESIAPDILYLFNYWSIVHLFYVLALESINIEAKKYINFYLLLIHGKDALHFLYRKHILKVLAPFRASQLKNEMEEKVKMEDWERKNKTAKKERLVKNSEIIEKMKVVYDKWVNGKALSGEEDKLFRVHIAPILKKNKSKIGKKYFRDFKRRGLKCNKRVGCISIRFQLSPNGIISSSSLPLPFPSADENLPNIIWDFKVPKNISIKEVTELIAHSILGVQPGRITLFRQFLSKDRKMFMHRPIHRSQIIQNGDLILIHLSDIFYVKLQNGSIVKLVRPTTSESLGAYKFIANAVSKQLRIDARLMKLHLFTDELEILSSADIIVSGSLIYAVLGPNRADFINVHLKLNRRTHSESSKSDGIDVDVNEEPIQVLINSNINTTTFVLLVYKSEKITDIKARIAFIFGVPSNAKFNIMQHSALISPRDRRMATLKDYPRVYNGAFLTVNFGNLLGGMKSKAPSNDNNNNNNNNNKIRRNNEESKDYNVDKEEEEGEEEEEEGKVKITLSLN